MSSHPNIVIIMTDQQRADVSAREGFSLDTTPFLDEFAKKGVWFSRAYAAVPICAASRISMLTGRYASAHRVRENRGVQYATYHLDLIDMVRSCGYATALCGKNHSHLTPERVDHWLHFGHNGGSEEGRTPEEAAFDEWLSVLNHGVSLEATPFPVECQGPYRAVSDAQRWIGSLDGRQPFFLWLSFAEPHNPYQVPEPYFSMFPPEELPPTATDVSALEEKSFKWRWTRRLGEYAYPNYDELIPRARANYFGMLRLIDDQVHRFVDFLSSKQLLDNTLILFVSDHGDFVGEYGLMRKGPEMPEVLMRVPFQICGPGIHAATGPREDHVSLIDIMPTLCEAIGMEIPRGVQGRSLWPMLTGQEYPREEFESVYAEQGFGGLHYTEDDPLSFEHCMIPGPVRPSFDELNSYSQSGTMRMLRKGDWKLIMDMQGRGQLYNLASDPYEVNNLYGSAEHAQVQCDMLARLLAWTIRSQDPLPYPVGRYIYKRDQHNYYAPYAEP